MTGTGNILFGIAVLVANVSCSHQAPEIKSTNIAVSEQATPTDIKRRWEEECKKLDPSKLAKDYLGKKLEIMAILLEQAPAPQVKAELERIRKEPNDYDHMSEYDRYLLQAFFGTFARKKDRDMLVYLLSAKCPRFIATSPVELEVASVETKEPFLILFDSYDAATDSEKHFLIDVLRDSLKDLSEKYSDDNEFMRMSRTWYQENVSRIKANPYYHPAGRGEQRDLFVSKVVG